MVLLGVAFNTGLALLSQYACCHMGFLIVRIVVVENINEFQTARIKVLGPTVAAGEAGTDKQTDRRKRRKYIWI